MRVDLQQGEAFTGLVRTFLSTVLGGALLSSGCAAHRGSSAGFSDVPNPNRPSVSLPSKAMTVTADNLLVGKVTKVNTEGRFVVMTFPIGHLPALQQRLGVYRNGLKIGEIRVTGPQLDDSVVGDILAGDAQTEDDVRAQ